MELDGGNITIRRLRQSDFGYYECVARNEVATIVTSTQVGSREGLVRWTELRNNAIELMANSWPKCGLGFSKL